jgi:hypothetical protein
MGISLGNRILNLESSNTIFWSQGEVFIKDVTDNVTLTFSDIENKSIKIVVNNTDTLNDYTITFSVTGRTIRNSDDIMSRLRANKTQVYEFVSDNTGTYIYCLSPLRLEAIYAP